MTTTIGSLDLKSADSLYNDATQYFWFESDSTATYGAGVHITLSPSSTFMSNPTGQNILINTDGISIRNGLLPMMTLDNDSLDFNVVDTTEGTYTTTATFTATGAQIGQSSGAHSIIDANGQRFYATNGTTQLANIGYGEGGKVAEGETMIAPYYTLGRRKTTTQQYDSSSVYSIGAICIYDEKLYVCTEAIETPEAWNWRHWMLATGAYSFAEGIDTIASAYGAHAEGELSIALGMFSHAEGYNGTYYTSDDSPTIASNLGSHAEGGGSIAGGIFSHAEGDCSCADQTAAHAEGSKTVASGFASHAEGYETSANGYASHSQNAGTIADQNYQTAIGTYNTANNTDNLFAIGNGTSSSSRSDAFTVDTSGNVNISGYYQANTVMIGSSISIRGEDDVTMSVTTDWKTPSMRVTDYNYGNAFIDANDTSLTDETSGVYCYYDGLVQVQGTIRFESGFTANDNLYVRIENITQGTVMHGLTRFRTPMTAPNETSISPTQVMRVSAGDVIKVSARNATGSRGVVANDASYLNMTYIAPVLPIPT